MMLMTWPYWLIDSLVHPVYNNRLLETYIMTAPVPPSTTLCIVIMRNIWGVSIDVKCKGEKLTQCLKYKVQCSPCIHLWTIWRTRKNHTNSWILYKISLGQRFRFSCRICVTETELVLVTSPLCYNRPEIGEGVAWMRTHTQQSPKSKRSAFSFRFPLAFLVLWACIKAQHTGDSAYLTCGCAKQYIWETGEAHNRPDIALPRADTSWLPIIRHKTLE
jgi:hypothetical protein